MKLKHILAGNEFELWMKPNLPEEAIDLGIGYIDPDDSGQAYKLRVNGKLWNISLCDKSNGYDLNHHLKRGCARLVEVVQVAKDGSALVKIVFFNGNIIEIGNIEIGIDERIEETARKNGIRFLNTDALGEVLKEKCQIRTAGEVFFVITTGPAANTDFEPDNQEPATSQAIIQQQYRAFSVYGERVRLPVERRSIDKATDIFFATKVVFKDSQRNEGALRLARGSVVFLDYTKTGRIRALAAGAMNQLTKESGSYLKQWDEYGEIEGRILLSRAVAALVQLNRIFQPKRGYSSVYLTC